MHDIFMALWKKERNKPQVFVASRTMHPGCPSTQWQFTTWPFDSPVQKHADCKESLLILSDEWCHNTYNDDNNSVLDYTEKVLQNALSSTQSNSSGTGVYILSTQRKKPVSCLPIQGNIIGNMIMKSYWNIGIGKFPEKNSGNLKETCLFLCFVVILLSCFLW